MQTCLILFIPALTAVFAWGFKYAAGPFWLGPNSDPSYFYLLNSLYILDHVTPNFTDHPGTTLQVLGAVIIKLLNWNASQVDMLKAVFLNPEFYLQATSIVLIVLYVISLAVLGWYAYKKTADILFAVCTQTGSLLLFSIPGSPHFPSIDNVNSDAFLMTAVNMFAAGLLKLYFSKEKNEHVHCSLGLAFVTAFALVTKMTALPWVFISLFLLPGWKNRFIYIIALVSMWLAFTFPIWPQFPKMFTWIDGLILHKGMHGAGGAGFMDMGVYLGNVWAIIAQNPFYCFVLAGAGVVSFERGKRGFFLRILVLAGLMQLLMIGKQFGAHYIIPAVGMVGLIAALIYERYKSRIPRYIFISLLGIFTASNVIFMAHDQQYLVKYSRTVVDFSRNIQEKYKDHVICGYYRSSLPLFPLGFWNDGDGPQHFSALLKLLYPDFYFYDMHGFKDFNNRHLTLAEVKQGRKGVLIYGTKYNEEFFKPSMAVQRIETSSIENVYRVLAHATPEASQYLMMSLAQFQQGKCDEALRYLLYAKYLGLSEDVDGYLLQLKAKCAPH